MYVVFDKTERGLLPLLLRFLCVDEIYNLSVYLSVFLSNQDRQDYFAEDSTSVLPDVDCLHRDFYKWAIEQFKKAIIELRPEVFPAIQVAARHFDEGSILFSGEIVTGV